MPKTINSILFNDNGANDVAEEKQTKHEQKIEYLLEQLFTRDNIEMKTDLNPKGIKAIARGKMHSAIFNDDLVGSLCDTIMVLNVSKDRQGRKEATDLSKTLATDDNPTDGGIKDFVNRLGGSI